MKIFGWQVPLTSRAISGEVVPAETKALAPAGSQTVGTGGSWWTLIRESFAGAWQQNVEVDPPKNLLAFSAVFACVTLIASDISKLRIKLMRAKELEDQSRIIWQEVLKGSPFLALFRKPNHYQNRLQFIMQWIISKLLWGNTYVLKRRDARNVINALYILDPQRVKVLVTPSGDVYYELQADWLAQLFETNTIAVPASEVIHDLMNPLWHPLVGVSPIYACGASATQGNKIQQNSSKFFQNASRPSGMLSAPGEISDSTALRLKTYWEENFTGDKIGRLAVLGDGLKYEAMTIPANDAQLIDQLKWTVEDVARAFHMPMYKIGGAIPASPNNVEALNQLYYNDCIQVLIEALELCLDEGVELPATLGTELDLNGLIRMDSTGRYAKISEAIKGGWLAPNEGRAQEDYEPVTGGESPMMQQQNWSLAQLANRSGPTDASSVQPAPTETPSEEEQAAKALEEFLRGIDAEVAA